MIGFAFYFHDVCGLQKKSNQIFEALIVSDVNKAAISAKVMLINCNYL
jgi:hypothetical protein